MVAMSHEQSWLRTSGRTSLVMSSADASYESTECEHTASTICIRQEGRGVKGAGSGVDRPRIPRVVRYPKDLKGHAFGSTTHSLHGSVGT